MPKYVEKIVDMIKIRKTLHELKKFLRDPKASVIGPSQLAATDDASQTTRKNSELAPGKLQEDGAASDTLQCNAPLEMLPPEIRRQLLSVPMLEQPTSLWVVLVPYPRNDSFVGRAPILNQLKQLPLKSASQTRTALYGLGGIGKTQIALEYSYWLHEAYPEVSVFWVHASNAERVRQAYTSIAQECRIPSYNDSKSDILTLVKRWLEQEACCQWLMVIDNADDIQLFFGQQGGSEINDLSNDKGNLERYLPECRHGAILVTTRIKQASLKLTKGKRLIEVVKMNEGETDQLLHTHLEGSTVTSKEASTLSSRLEHLPLALIQAAAFIQENTIDISGYLELLDNGDQDLIDLLSEEFETGGRDSETPRAVAKTWTLSFKQIQRQNAFAGQLLSFMSLLDRQAIPLDFLSRYSEQQQDQETKGKMQLIKALGVLKAFSFIVEKKDHGFNMHRLVQLVTRRWLAKKGKIRHFAGQVLLAVSYCYPFGRYENWAVCSAYLAHAYAVLGSEGTGPRDEKAEKATLLYSVAGFFAYQGQWRDAERLQLETVKLREEVLGSDHPDTLTVMDNLASTYNNQGRWEEAEKLLVQVIETGKTKLGADHPSTLASIHNLALTYQKQGRYKESKELFIQVIQTNKTRLRTDHPDMLASMANLASTYYSQGQLEEAEKLLLQVMETSKMRLGADHPDTLTRIHNLASTYYNKGRWEESEILLVQVIETRKTKFGADHPDTLASMNSLAHVWKVRGRDRDAVSMIQACYDLRQRVLGVSHPYTVSTLSTLESWLKENEGPVV